MTDQEQKEYEKLRRQKEKQLNRQKKYADDNYDRIAFVGKKGSRAIIREHYTKKGYKSLADYFLTLAKLDGCPIDYEINLDTSSFEKYAEFGDDSEKLPF